MKPMSASLMVCPRYVSTPSTNPTLATLKIERKLFFIATGCASLLCSLFKKMPSRDEDGGSFPRSPSLPPFVRPLLAQLLTPQRQQLSVGREQLSHRVLELPPFFYKWTELFHPLLGNALDVFLTVDHEGERPHRMAFSIGAVAARFSATPVRLGERTR